MAHKSKTQRAKATAAKANKKERQLRDEAAGVDSSQPVEKVEEKKSGILNLIGGKKDEQQSTPAKKEEKKPKKQRFKFLKEVKAEMKRVTWPTRQDVIRWSCVVVAALLFFGIFTAVLDNLIVMPALFAISGLGGA